ncbi:hypothetical protein NST84_21695 [Paenibacillus sp. FSL R7-0345]|uniref:glycoside hydrolase family 78 protein n=1 Tax=Paenibacillus sp. FSL R7-0345 TaxID=2954535 RepID=UPI00315A86B8
MRKIYLRNAVNPTQSSINKPSITWSQTDAALTQFTAYQVNVLDETGGIIHDTGEIKTSTIVTNGTWIPSNASPTFEPIQIKVRVKDETMWSEWSNAGWMEIVSMFSLRSTQPLDNSIEISQSKITAGETATVKLSVYGNVYS